MHAAVIDVCKYSSGCCTGQSRNGKKGTTDHWKKLQTNLSDEEIYFSCRSKWHQFIRNEDISAATSLPSISDTISHVRCNALFGHVAKLPDDVPAHKTLSCHINLWLGWSPSSHWRRCPAGRPHNRWVDQLWTDNNIPPADLWRRAVNSGQSRRRYGPCWLSDNNNKAKDCGITCQPMITKQSIVGQAANHSITIYACRPYWLALSEAIVGIIFAGQCNATLPSVGAVP